MFYTGCALLALTVPSRWGWVGAGSGALAMTLGLLGAGGNVLKRGEPPASISPFRVLWLGALDIRPFVAGFAVYAVLMSVHLVYGERLGVWQNVLLACVIALALFG